MNEPLSSIKQEELKFTKFTKYKLSSWSSLTRCHEPGQIFSLTCHHWWVVLLLNCSRSHQSEEPPPLTTSWSVHISWREADDWQTKHDQWVWDKRSVYQHLLHLHTAILHSTGCHYQAILIYSEVVRSFVRPPLTPFSLYFAQFLLNFAWDMINDIFAL